MSFKLKALAVTLTSLLTGACSTQHVHNDSQLQTNETAIVGTTVPFASEAVYFVVTDRFVDGDPSNNHEDRGRPSNLAATT